MPKKIIFTQEETNDIISHYKNGISSEKICLKYNVSASRICGLLKENNIKLRGSFKDIDNNLLIDMYLSKKYTTNEICLKFSISITKILSILSKNNIILKSSKKYSYNENIFENIDKEEKAYWLGFLYADGYVRERNGGGSELKLKLSIIDKDHLLKFKKFISDDENIPIVYEESKNKKKKLNDTDIQEYYNNSRTYKISINSKKIVSDLIKLGCTNNKSKTIEFPNIDESFYKDFIRGYFDGDGSISYSKKAIVLNFVSGSLNFLKRISYELNKNCNCKYANLIGASNNYKYICYTSLFDIQSIYNYLYKNEENIKLDRKLDKIKHVIENYNDIINNINEGRRFKYKNK